MNPKDLLRSARYKSGLKAPLAKFNTADAVEHINTLELESAADTLGAVALARAAKILEQPELHRSSELFATLPMARAAAILTLMADDRATDIVHEMDKAHRRRLIPLLDEHTRQSISDLLQYPDQTAGSLMTTEFVSVPADWTLGRTLEYVREVERERETIYVIYIEDPDSRTLTQVVTMRRLITGREEDPILSVAQVNPPVTVDAMLDQEEVARLIRRHNLLSIPVVDAQQRILGIVTVDDVLDALIEESTEDAHKFGGMEALDKPYMHIGFLEMFRKRGGWLSVLFIGEMLTASAMQQFAGELAAAVVLTLFIPLIMSSGGNSGSQATSLLIRSLALRELRLRDWWRVALREIPTGLALGAFLGLIIVVRIVVWQTTGLYDYGAHWQLVALTIGLTMVGIVTFGALTGAMLPFILSRLGFDPASASAPFVATVVDVTGLVIYFNIAALILSGTLL